MDNSSPDPATLDPEHLLIAVYKELLEVKDVVLDLQKRQKEMESRQLTIKTEVDEVQEHEAPIVGSFGTVDSGKD